MELISGDECFRILDIDEYVFFYFTAPWCGPCQQILPDLNELIKKLESFPIRFFKIDIDDSDNDELCEKCNIKEVPSFLLFRNRKFLSSTKGAAIQGIIDMLKNECDFIENDDKDDDKDNDKDTNEK